MQERIHTSTWTFATILSLLIGGQGFAQDYKAQGKTQSILSYERIPSGFAYSHPSNVAITHEGTLLATFAGGPAEGEDTKIGVMRKAAGSGKWDQTGLFAPPGNGYDPTIFQPSAPGAPVILMYYANCCENHYMRTSTDDGVSWSPEFRPPATTAYDHNGGFFEGPEQNPPLETSNGDLLASHSVRQSGSPQQNWMTIIPADNYDGKNPSGSKWEARRLPGEAGQGSFLVFDPPHFRRLGLIARFAVNGPAQMLFSEDGGENWTQPEDAKVSGGFWSQCCGPKAGITGLSLDIGGGPAQGWHLGAGARGESCGLCRDHISVFASNDDGRNWQVVLEVKMTGGGEQADPTLIQDPATRKVWLIWTGRGQDGMGLLSLDPDVLVGLKDSPGQTVGAASPEMPPQGFALQALRRGDRSHLHFKLSAAGPVRLVLRDLSGKVVASKHGYHKAGRHSLPLDASQGIHLATLQTPQGLWTRKVLVP